MSKETSPKTGRSRRVIRRLAILVVGLAVLVVGLVINGARQPSLQKPVAKVDVEVDAARVAEILAEVISIPSISHEDRAQMDPEPFLRLHQVLIDRFPMAHETLERETINELGLLYTWPGSDRSLDPILLMSHIDVVPVEAESASAWTHPVDVGTIAAEDDGVDYVWGRGALDVKSGVIAIMAAMEELAVQGFQPERTIHLAFGHDEEVGGEDGNAVISQKFADEGVRLACVLDEGGAILDGIVPGAQGPVAFIGLAEKRPINLVMTAGGEGGHGSMPGRSAIINLAEAITLIEQNPMPIKITKATETMLDFLGPEMPLVQRTAIANRWLFRGFIARQFAGSPTTNAVVRSTANVTQLMTDSAENQSASVASANINARLLPGNSLSELRQHLLAVTNRLRLENGEPAIAFSEPPDPKGQAVAPVDCDEFRHLQRSIHEVFPDTIVVAGLTTVSTDSSWYYGVSDKVYRFIPMRMKAQDVVRVHGINERIATENLAEIVQFYIQFVRHSTSPRKT